MNSFGLKKKCKQKLPPLIWKNIYLTVNENYRFSTLHTLDRFSYIKICKFFIFLCLELFGGVRFNCHLKYKKSVAKTKPIIL